MRGINQLCTLLPHPVVVCNAEESDSDFDKYFAHHPIKSGEFVECVLNSHSMM